MEAVAAAYLCAQPAHEVVGVVTYKGVRAKNATKSTRASFHIRMERSVHGSLHRFIQSHTFHERMRVFQRMVDQLSRAIMTLHDQGFTHGDLKPSNVIVTDAFLDTFSCKVIDLGSCVLYRECEDKARQHEYCTYTHAPPEYFTRSCLLREDVIRKHDAYSLGAIMHDFIYKTSLYNVEQAESFDNVKHLHKNGLIQYPTSCPAGVPTHLFDMMMALLRVNPHQRASIDDVCRQPTSVRYIGMFYNYPRMNHAQLQKAWRDQQSMAYNIITRHINDDKIRSIALSMCDRFVYALGSPCSSTEVRACACIANTLITASNVSVLGDDELHDAIINVMQTLRCRVI